MKKYLSNDDIIINRPARADPGFDLGRKTEKMKNKTSNTSTPRGHSTNRKKEKTWQYLSGATWAYGKIYSRKHVANIDGHRIYREQYKTATEEGEVFYIRGGETFSDLGALLEHLRAK